MFTTIGGDGSKSVCQGEKKNNLFYQILDHSNSFSTNENTRAPHKYSWVFLSFVYLDGTPTSPKWKIKYL